MASYEQWLAADGLPEPLAAELHTLQGLDAYERFSRYLPVDASGMYGEMGAGTNRMNIYTTRRVAAGMARYMIGQGDEAARRGVVIAYDSRRGSSEFAEQAALTLCQYGVVAHLFGELCPAALLSFAIRYLRAAGGIVVSAGHRPSEYNGLQLYGADGALLAPSASKQLALELEAVDDELHIQVMDYMSATRLGMLQPVTERVYGAYLKALQLLAVDPDIVRTEGSSMRIVYTPLHGAGSRPVRDALLQAGFFHLYVVPEQEQPDGEFATVGSPDPQEQAMFARAAELGGTVGAELLLATDSSAERVGVAARDGRGAYTMLTGNQTGALLLEYILSRRKTAGTLPVDGIVAQTIATSALGRKIAETYNMQVVETLAGFQHIGECISRLDMGERHRFVFGYEESGGYLAGSFVRNKDAVQASMLIAEMAAYYRSIGLSLHDALQRLYARYGVHGEDTVAATFNLLGGMETLSRVMDAIRRDPFTEVIGVSVHYICDYLADSIIDLVRGRRSLTGLPPCNAIQFKLEDGSWILLSPSNTEPRLNIYLGACAVDEETVAYKISLLKAAMRKRLQSLEAALTGSSRVG